MFDRLFPDEILYNLWSSFIFLYFLFSGIDMEQCAEL